jgi:methionyl-tRNA formyltransferase
VSVIRILFLGTPDFAVAPLEALSKDPHFEIVRVITQPDKPAGRNLKLKPSPVKEKALELGLAVESYENINEPSVLEHLKSLNADSAIVVAFGQILSDTFLGLFHFGPVNVHSSLLPRWRGAAPMQRAIMADDAETGVALQVIVQKLDAGDVLGVRRVALTDDIDIVKLYEILKQKSCELVTVEFMDYIRGHLTGVAQDATQVTIAKKIKKEEGFINWSEPARTIFNRVRALKGWPGTWTLQSGKTLKILSAKLENQAPNKASPGTITRVSAEGLSIACGVGTLCVTEVQPESRAGMKVADYIRGYPLKEGDKLGT